MNSNRGIFEPQEGFAPLPPSKSPFAVADDTAASPFAVVPEVESPFATMKDEVPPRLTAEIGKPAKLPERRVEPVAVDGGTPFASVADAVAAGSPFGAAPVNPFGAAEPVTSGPSPAVAAAIAAATAPAAAPTAPAPAPVSAPVAASTPVAAPAVASPAAVYGGGESYESDSRSIRQLELRAIFGVDRELSADEILQRSRALPGIRHLARVAAEEIGVIDGLKRIVAGLGFAGGQVKLYAGSAPIEFVREGNVLLAVQTDGGFAPGVRETLILVARELGRL